MGFPIASPVFPRRKDAVEVDDIAAAEHDDVDTVVGLPDPGLKRLKNERRLV